MIDAWNKTIYNNYNKDKSSKIMFVLLLFLSFCSYSVYGVHVAYTAPTTPPFVIISYYTSNLTQPCLEEHITDASNLNIYRYIGKSEASAIYIWFKYSGNDEDTTRRPINMILDGKRRRVQGIIQSRKVDDPEHLYKYVFVKIHLTNNDSFYEDGVINLSIGETDRKISLEYVDSTIGSEKINFFIINSSFTLNLQPTNMSSLKVGEQYIFNLSYSLPPSIPNYVDYIAVSLPYTIIKGERPTHILDLCSDESDTLPVCNDGQKYSFNINTSKIDVSDSFFNITIILKGKMMGGEREKEVFYYLDKDEPTAQLLNSNLNNGSTYYSFNFINFSFNLEDVYSCYLYVDGQLKFSGKGDGCSHIYLNGLTQRDHNILYKVHDYANNTNTYYFVYYINKTIAYITQQGSIYKEGREIGKVMKELENNTGFIIPKFMKRRVVGKIKVWSNDNIYGAYVEGNSPLEDLTIIGCEGMRKLNNNTFICSQEINNTSLINQSTDGFIVPIHYSFLGAYQDPTQISSINGFDYVILPVNISNVDYLYNITHLPLHDLSYNFYDSLPYPWNSFICQQCSGHISSVDRYQIINLNLKKKGIYALPIYSYYIPTPIITLYYNDNSIYIHHKFMVYNTINVDFTNVRVDLPPPYYTSYHFINSSACTLVSPQYISIKAKEEKEIDVKYKCRNVINTHFSYVILKQKGNDTHRYFSAKIQLSIPNSPLFTNKYFSYIIDESYLKGFPHHSSITSFVDDISSPVEVNKDNELINITTPLLPAGEHDLYIKYWYKRSFIPSPNKKILPVKKNEKEDEKNAKIINGTKNENKNVRSKGQGSAREKKDENKSEVVSSSLNSKKVKKTDNLTNNIDKKINEISDLSNIHDKTKEEEGLYLRGLLSITGNIINNVAGIFSYPPTYLTLLLLVIILYFAFSSRSRRFTFRNRINVWNKYNRNIQYTYTHNYTELKKIKDVL